MGCGQSRTGLRTVTLISPGDIAGPLITPVCGVDHVFSPSDWGKRIYREHSADMVDVLPAALVDGCWFEVFNTCNSALDLLYEAGANSIFCYAVPTNKLYIPKGCGFRLTYQGGVYYGERLSGRNERYQLVVLSSGMTWYTPYTSCRETIYKVTLTGGGAGGEGPDPVGFPLDQFTMAGAGGAGATAINRFQNLPPHHPIEIVVGQGGLGGNAGTRGQHGEDSSFDTGLHTPLIARGGKAWLPHGYGEGGTSSGGALNISGGDGSDLFATRHSANCAHGGASYWGGGGGSGANGKAYGAGGGGGSNGGGNGKHGLCVIEWLTDG